VTVNDQGTKSSYHIKPGDKIDIILPPPPLDEIPPEPIPLNVVYEDSEVLIINKQSNLLVHPARGNPSGTLVNGLVHYSQSLSRVNGNFRPGIVHRLDRNTTGILVVAKTDTAHWRLAHQFEHRKVEKIYYAVVHGTVALDADVIDAPLGRHPHVREKYAVRPESGKPAVTAYSVEKQYRGYALVKLKPKTGRTHQLRVHMASLKHPIVGDTMYGGKLVTLGQLSDGKALPGPGEAGSELGSDNYIIERQALHAGQITLRHPISGELMTHKAPFPADMQLLITLLDRYRRI
jgi:23S rRNA pseudouridine1911/1915/1917 synthase